MNTAPEFHAQECLPPAAACAYGSASTRPEIATSNSSRGSVAARWVILPDHAEGSSKADGLLFFRFWIRRRFSVMVFSPFLRRVGWLRQRGPPFSNGQFADRFDPPSGKKMHMVMLNSGLAAWWRGSSGDQHLSGSLGLTAFGKRPSALFAALSAKGRTPQAWQICSRLKLRRAPRYSIMDRQVDSQRVSGVGPIRMIGLRLECELRGDWHFPPSVRSKTLFSSAKGASSTRHPRAAVSMSRCLRVACDVQRSNPCLSTGRVSSGCMESLGNPRAVVVTPPAQQQAAGYVQPRLDTWRSRFFQRRADPSIMRAGKMGL